MSLEKICHRSLSNFSHWFSDFSIFLGAICSHYFVFLWVAALLWLLRRSQILLSRSRSELIDKLGLTEPVIPRLALDGLGDTWVSINWHYPSTSTSRSRRPRVRKHIVMVDDKIYEVERDQRRAYISNLLPGKIHKITVQAVQTNGDNSLIPSQVTNAAATNAASPSQLPGGTSSNSMTSNVALGVSKPIYFHTFSSAQDSVPPLEAMLKADVPKFQKLELEKVKALVAIREETREVLSNLTSTENQFLIKQRGLTQKYSDLSASRKSDEAKRTLIRVENKNLEDENHALEVQISKTKLQAAKIAKSSVDLGQESVRIAELEKLQLEREAENTALLDLLSRKVIELQERETELIREVKRATQVSRNLEFSGERANGLIQNIKNIIFNASLEEKLMFLRSKEAESLGPEALAQIEREVELDNRIEHEWARAQKALEQQYVDAYLYNSEQKLQQSQQQLLHEQVTIPQTLANVPIGTGPMDLFNGMGSNASLSLMTPSATNRSHTGTMSLASSSPLPPLNLPSHQPIHSPASLTSIQSLSSMQGIYPTPTTSINSVQSILPAQYDPFNARQSSVLSLAPSSRPESLSQNHGKNTISPATADNLLPANLFQDGLTNTASPAQELDKSDLLEEQTNSDSKPRDAAWLPWLMPHGKSPTSRRTTSLFFGNHADTHETDAELTSAVEDKEVSFDNQIPAAGESSSGRSPSKGMSSRIFQKGGHRTGSFVRRLSIFSRKDMESKQDAGPVQVDSNS